MKGKGIPTTTKARQKENYNIVLNTSEAPAVNFDDIASTTCTAPAVNSGNIASVTSTAPVVNTGNIALTAASTAPAVNCRKIIICINQIYFGVSMCIHCELFS